MGNVKCILVDKPLSVTGTVTAVKYELFHASQEWIELRKLALAG